MDLWRLPDDPILRLKHYQHERALDDERSRALDEERERAEAALKVPEKERTQAERNAIAYSVPGSAPGCHCGY